MDAQEFVDEVLKPALDLVAEEYDDDSLLYEDTKVAPKGIGTVRVEINGQAFLVGVMRG